MTVLNNSSFKVQAEPVATTTGLVPEKGAIIFDLSTGEYKCGDGSAWMVISSVPYPEPYYRDMKSPFVGLNLDSASTRYSVNRFNGGVTFNADARYPNEILSMQIQIQHDWAEGTNGLPHLHWKQQGAAIPNWLMIWKLSRNGEADVIETDFSNYNFEVLQSHEYTYTAGVLNQISDFPTMDLSGAKISDEIVMHFFRDTTNVSGAFAGADPSLIAEIAVEMDIHIEINSPGSRTEYVK